jgi:predicted AlkP superfamily phosphohydrolase/phosphomutase
MKVRNRIVLICAALGLLAASGYLLIPKFFPKKTQVLPQKKQRVYLIGFDGASWNLMERPLREHKLPNFKKLIDTGTSGPLKSFVPTKSPILWTTIATGKVPKKHGVGSYTAEVNGKVVPVSGMQRGVKAYWNILSDFGVKVGVVNWWVTWPPEKVNGFMVSDHYRSRVKGKEPNLTYPADLINELPGVPMTMERYLEDRKKFGLPTELRPPQASSKNIDELADTYKSYWAQDRAVRETCKRLLNKKDVDVFGVVFRITDVSSHLFWTYLDMDFLTQMRKKEEEGTLTREDIHHIDDEFSKIIEPIYVYADRILKDFMKKADENTTFIIVSDHGFKFEEGRYGHSSMKQPPDGIIILNGPLFKKHHRIENATLLDITPTLLYMEGIPRGKDMDGTILMDAFVPDFVNSHHPQLIASHDSGMKKGKAMESEEDKEILEDFKSLGYIQ